MDINKLWSGYDLNSKKQNNRCLAVNTILEGKYLVGPVLGQGGFGITYVGYDLNMETRIAIKEYFPVELVSRDTTTMHGDRVLSLSGEKSVTYQQGLKKYVAEAQNVSQFSEVPGVVSVKDFFYANETAYIVMEFIDGISLKDYLKERGGRLSEEETLRIMKPVLEALVQVHKAGIIHRDISPDNIMLTFEDAKASHKIQSVKLIDFGAARMTAKNDQKSLTIILKHGYAPEEQYRTHGEQGPWTDVYAICATMYRMLTGETPVPAMDRLFQDELKKPSDMGVKLSAGTEAAILKGLAVKKDDRIKTMQELIGALYDGVRVKATGKKDNNGKKGVYIAAAAVAAGVVIMGVVIGSGKPAAKTGTTIPEAGTEAVLSDSRNYENSMAPTQTETASQMKFAEVEEEILGDQIAFYYPQYSIDTRSHTLICKPDGTVEARGDNAEGQCNVEDWTHVVSVQCGDHHSLGLRSDGTVYAAGRNDSGECNVSHWENVVQICAEGRNSFGLTQDGTILIAGAKYAYGEEVLREIGSWTDIQYIAADSNAFVGIQSDETLKIAGIDREVKLEDWTEVETVTFSGQSLVGLEADGTLHAVDLFSEAEKNMLGINSATVSSDYAKMDGVCQISAPYQCGVSVDGTVVNYGLYREKAWNSWTNLIAIQIIGSGQAIGLQSDGTILEDYDVSNFNTLEEFTDLRWAQLAPYGYDSGIVGQKKDGTALYYGSYDAVHDMCKALEPGQELSKVLIWSPDEVIYSLEDGSVHLQSFRADKIWEEYLKGVPELGVSQIDEFADDSYFCVMEDGSVEGAEPYYGLDLKEKIGAWKDMKEISGYSTPIWGLKQDGTVISTESEDVLAENIVDICAVDSICLGVKEDGTAQAIEVLDDDINGCAQITGWNDIVQIEMSDSHTVGLRSDGTVVAVGSNHCGQCDVEEWREVIAIDTCSQCTIGITKDGNLLMAGSLY